MELNEAINTRSSVRNYDGNKKIDAETLKILIDSANQAPSWKNSQTARYHCILSEKKIDEFSRRCLPEFNQKNSSGASALIVTSFVKDHSGYDRATGKPSNEVGNGWGFYDLGLQNENLLLKAKEMGLDTLVMGIRDEVEIRNMLDVEKDEIIVSVIAIGYALKYSKKPERKNADEIAKFY